MLRSFLALARASEYWLCAAVTPSWRGAKIGARAQRQHFQIVLVDGYGLIGELAIDIVIFRYRFEAQQLAQRCEGLHLGEFSGAEVHLKLQHLEFDFQQVAFTHGPGPVPCLTDLDRLLKAVEVGVRQLEVRFGQKRADELLRHARGYGAFIVGHSRGRHRGGVAGRIEAPLPLFAALDQITDADVELGVVLQVVGGKNLRREEWQELRIPTQVGIRAQERGGFLSSILIYGRARGEQRVVVLQGQLDRAV